MMLCYGNDHATVAASIDKLALIDGGPGDDQLNGGGGSNILLGGAGDDQINGGAVRDILIGGAGADRIVANPGEDMLIGGLTAYDSDPEAGRLANDEALLELLEQWNSTDPFADRVDYLQPLIRTIVEDDEDEDELTGASGEDWFVTGVGDVITGSDGNGKKK